jgi:hypothetical protein
MSVRVTASFVVPADLLKQVDDLADAQRLSRSQLLETWIRDRIEGEKVNLAMVGNPAVMKAMMQAFSDPNVMKSFASAVSEDLSTDQLELFHRGMAQVHDQARAAVKPPKAPPSRAKKKGGPKK